MHTLSCRTLSSNARLTTSAAHRSARPFGLWRAALQAMMIVTLFISSFSAIAVSAATTPADLAPAQSTPAQVRQWVRQTVVEVKPALHKTVDQVLPGSLQILVAQGKLSAPMAANFAQIFIEGKAPAGQPEIAHALNLPAIERTAYSLQRLQQEGLLSAQEVQLFNSLRNADDASVRDQAVAALESDSYGLLATAILQTVVDLTAINTDRDYETCDAASSSLRAQGWLGDALRWVGGLAKSVLDGALNGAFYGFLLGGGKGAMLGALFGGIAGGIEYIADSTGNGFMPGPNGEDCTGWPRPFPGGF